MAATPSTGRFLRDVLIVAGQELAESIRTKRAILLIILFCGSTIFDIVIFTKVLKAVEKEFVSGIGLDEGASGSATATLWKSQHFRSILIGVVRGDRDYAMSLLQFSPIGLFYGWLMITLTPWLVAMTSTSRITEEIWSGSARFVLCRTTRLAWLLGKYIGQSLQLLVALMLTVVVAWLTARIALESFDGAATFRDMLLFAPRAWIYGISFLGFVSGLSMYCKSPGIANVLGIVGFLVTWMIYGISEHYAGEGWRRIFDVVLNILPQYYYLELMRPDWSRALPAVIFLIALGLGYLLIGYARLAKKDL